jgi:glucosamine-6-phosphate deaminase
MATRTGKGVLAVQTRIFDSKREAGRAAADAGAGILRDALRAHGEVNIVLATGASQFEVLEALAAAPDIDWSKVTVFHLDEYVGLPISHPASFRRYLQERFVAKLPVPLRAFHEIDGEGDCRAECDRLNQLIQAATIAVAFVGIGENGHLAFNDPPADFKTEMPYIVVNLDDACRRQQFGEGWFPTLEDVPGQAISMSVRQILKARAIICTVPEERKAQAVKGTVEGAITPMVPASILQEHPTATLYLDRASASLLSPLKS